MKHLADDGPRPGKGLRQFLREKIGDLAETWFRKGFNRGHRESYAANEQGEGVPTTLEYECTRKLSPGQRRELELSSTIKTKKKAVKKNVKKATTIRVRKG
ncbi:hypothetical protein [Acidiphilium sp. MT5]